MSQYQIAVGVGVIVVLAALLGWWLWRRNRGPEIARALEAVAIDRLQNVLVPDGMGGHIQVEHLLLTGQGLVVIDAKAFVGTIFASERMAEWTVIGKQGRFTFPNPLGTLYDRVAALRQLVRDVPVAGHVLFAGGADFTKGRPRDVLLRRRAHRALSSSRRSRSRALARRVRAALGPRQSRDRARTLKLAR